jgi:hypothetical protein
MTPKEKAIELCQKIGMLGLDSDQTGRYTLELSLAKRCAIIACDEIIKLDLRLSPYESISPIDYWNEVKREIESL